MPDRKSLLITTVGKKAAAICKCWCRPERTYDVCLINYDDDIEFDDCFAEYYSKMKGFKYPLILKQFIECPEFLGRYDYFFMPDDDIVIDSRQIDKLFSFASEQKLALCQPSLYPVNYSWPVTVHNPLTRFRFVKMVEIMCPLFSTSALKKCMFTFGESQSGWGLEPVWAKVLAGVDKGIAIYDDVIAIHSRPLDLEGGPLYAKLKDEGIFPELELGNMLTKYDVELDFSEVATVLL